MTILDCEAQSESACAANIEVISMELKDRGVAIGLVYEGVHMTCSGYQDSNSSSSSNKVCMLNLSSKGLQY